jgi:co-chaperonin GroES (HSP10)
LFFVRAGFVLWRGLSALLRACCAAKLPLRVHYNVICTHQLAACSLTTSLTAPTLSLYLSEGFVRPVARLCLVWLLLASLLDLPAFAAAEKPLGSVIQAQEAQLDNAKLQVGTSIYRGDTVVTDAGGGLRLKLGGSQLYLLADSAATLAQNATAIHAVVGRGTVGFSSNGADSIELEIPQGILRAADGQPAYGQVTIMSAQEVVISAYRGALVLDNDGELHTIPAGKNYRVTLEWEQADQQASPASTGGDNPIIQPRKRRRRRLAFYLIFTGALAAASYAIWDHLDESPYKP